MTDTGCHLIIYSPDGIAIAHHQDGEVVNQLADAINAIVRQAARNGQITTAEIVEAAGKIMEGMRND